ncbi:RNA polymerase factor sigma-54 [Desulfonatronum lacustre]|uniref:RNA polymerase factor sigma-54 n=1 Tax=Desulfonatronum lacustre TaxID=66849 RepID=UPI00048FD4AD|nr:RNA polymerase factor sigma-54 [Desulfonatronum lacustre]SMP53110.1 RNA polymerase, sigma 54 subunit, RpoN/SigL [Desulfonatronum zhilinae]
MALELRQQLKLTQQLVMTPQLQQAIKLLQLSRLELVESIQQELLENPVLEIAPEGIDETVETPIKDPAEDRFQSVNVEEPRQLHDSEWQDYLGEFSSISRQIQGRDWEVPEEGMSFEARLAGKSTLIGHLSWQLRLSALSERELAVSEVILGNLDAVGYLCESIEDIAAMAGCETEEAERILRIMQRLDPVGVCARNLRECLLVQMDELGLDDPILVSLVKDHLEELEKRRYKPLAKKFKLSMEEIKHYLDCIQRLDPMPGKSFGSDDPQFTSPDVYILQHGGDFIVVLNEDEIPGLMVNEAYAKELSVHDKGTRDYIQEKVRSAHWLMKSLYQRQRTLHKVAESIVRFQIDFFRHGVTHLKPMILKDVALDINMHESTVSRITTSKYMSTPHGTYELKFFFNSALGMDDGSEAGSESVKAEIKKLISEEDPKRPLSDELISQLLKKSLGVNIARRTVAKYRMALNIESSSKRKAIF